MPRRYLISLALAAALAACGGTNKPINCPVCAQTAGNTAGNGAADSNGATDAAWKSGPPKKVTAVEGITEYTLDNGLRVLLFPDDSQEKVTVNITYFVGSRLEGYGETGMAHLLEHMMFKGTPTHDDIWKSLQAHGAQFNGTTSYDRTNYYETMPSTDDNLTWALNMEADRMVNSKIAQEDLSKEFSVVRNEFEMGENNPLRVLEARIISAAYLWHNYGKSTIGSKSDIERVPASRLKVFYKKYYRPDNAMLVVAGKFDPKRALDLVGQTFGTVAKPATPIEDSYTVEPVQDGEKEIFLRRTGDSQYIGVLYHGVAGADAAFVPMSAAADILTVAPSGRLYKALVEKKLATRVWNEADPLREPGYVLFWAEVPKGKQLAPVRDKMISIIEGLGKSKILPAEVNRFIAKSDKQMELFMTSSQRVAIALTEFASLGDWRMLFVMRDRADKVSADAIATAASNYFKRSNRTVGMFTPIDEKKIDRSPLPKQPDVVALTKDYKGRAATSQGEVFDASYDNIEKRTERYTLKSGMKVALLPKRTRGKKVEGRIGIYFGNDKVLKGKTTAADLVADMLMRGTKKHSYQQLKDELDRLKASVSIQSAKPGLAMVTISTTHENLLPVIDLVAEMLEQPTFPRDQFDLVTRAQLTDLEGNLQNPQALAINQLRRTLTPYPKGDVRYVPTIPEQIAMIKKTKVSDLKRLHKAYWGATYAKAAFVGDFDSTEVKGALEKAFSGWKSHKKYARIEHKYIPTKGSDNVIRTPDKKMAFILAAKTIKLRDDDPDYAALTMVGYVLGGGASSRLLNRLRQKEGWSYGAFGAIQAGAQDTLGAIFGGAILAPQNADKGMTAMLEEIKRLFDKGIPKKELDDAIAAYLKKSKSQLANDQFVVTQLARDLEIGRTMAFDAKLDEQITKLTPEVVQMAIKKHLNADNLSLIKAGDLAAKK